jgi:hypothetical protein
MSPVSRKTGRRYAAGSHTTLGGWEPKRCCLCGERLVVSRQSLRFSRFPEPRGWHVDCERKAA